MSRERRTARSWLRATAWAVVLVVAMTATWSLGAGCVGGGTTTTSTGSGAGQAVTFESDDGVDLGGRLFGSGDRGVVLLHMYPADQTSWYGTAEHLADAGYLVLTLDFRGYGESGGEKEIAMIDRDVRAAVAEISRQGASGAALVGASMGGTAALMAADTLAAGAGGAGDGTSGETAPVIGIATLSAPVEFKGLDASQAVTRLAVSKLFLGTEEDSGGQAAQQLYDRAAEPRQVEVFAGDEHGTDMLSGPEGPAVLERLDTWLAAAFDTSEDG